MTNTKKKKIGRLAFVKQNVIGCTACDLCFERNRIVFGEGTPDADIMILGEAPGKSENESGRPFVGRAGNLLGKWMEEINLTREDVFIANIVKCRPPGNRTPKPDEISACISYLHQQIDIIQPKVIVLLGAVALKSLFRDDSLGISKNRGKWMSYKDIPVMPMYHPAFLLRQMSEKNKSAVRSDLKIIEEMVEK